MRLAFETPQGTFAVQCDTARAPDTLAALAALLPMRAHLHTPKIAGSHVYWQVPIIADAEGAADVMSAPPGTFLYWPERQFLELIFAPLQAETATVTLLGRMEGDIAPLSALGEFVRLRQGHELVECELRLEGGPLPEAREAPTDAAGALAELRRALWADCPDEIGRLMGGRGLMHPAGPLFTAEAEARGLHETLWWLRLRLKHEAEPAVAMAARTVCRKAAARLGGFCHLERCAEAVEAVDAALGRPGGPVDAILTEGIMIAGALSSWLDLQIPWNDVNETVRAVRDGRLGEPGRRSAPART